MSHPLTRTQSTLAMPCLPTVFLCSDFQSYCFSLFSAKPGGITSVMELTKDFPFLKSFLCSDMHLQPHLIERLSHFVSGATP